MYVSAHHIGTDFGWVWDCALSIVIAPCKDQQFVKGDGMSPGVNVTRGIVPCKLFIAS